MRTATAPESEPTPPPPPDALSSFAHVPIADLFPSPLNPRTHFDVADLVDSVRTHGVIVPLLARPKKGKLEIIEGERRYRAAKAAGTLFLPVKSQELTDAQVLELMLLANGQRQDLTPLEEARGYKRLLENNPSKYSVAYIAQRISRSERYVADRMRLLELTPEIQALLDAERILVSHAELLAKLKPEDQTRAIDPINGGLWAHEGSTLDFDTLNDDRDREADPYDGCKPRTVAELQAWIARRVRFDLDHFAATAPLDFGPTAAAVATAEAKEGRGKKWIAITRDYHVHPDAKTQDGDRIYGERSWRLADGSTGTSEGRHGTRIDSPVCDHAITGVFVAGPGYGTATTVCIAREKCSVHWKAEIAAKKKNDRLRAAGQGAKADAREKQAAESWDARQKRERAEQAIVTNAYKAIHPQMIEALATAAPTVFDRRMFDLVIQDVAPYTYRAPKNLTIADMPRELLLAAAADLEPSELNAGADFERLADLLKTFGVDVAPFERTFKAHQAEAKKAAAKKAAPKADAAKGGKATTAKKTAAKKTAKKR